MTDPKDPVWVHCECCNHPWIVAYTPMVMSQMAELFKGARCPYGHTCKVLMGRGPQPLPADLTAEQWLVSGDTGTSSQTIYSVMRGLPPPEWHGFPHDADDFGRCYRLLKRFPDWRPRLPEVAARHFEWQPFVEAWNDLTALYETVCDSGGHFRRDASREDFAAFSQRIRPIDDAACVIRAKR